MPDLHELHRHARAIFHHALTSVDPRPAVKRAISSLPISSSSIYSIAIGKAATSMALGLNDALGDKLSAPVVVSSGGHPLPNEASLASARAAFALIDRANNEKGTIIFLISGGGSAMIEWPISDDISLDDLRSANQTLISSGASISEINSVRRAFSAVKGGGLARRAPNAQIFTLIVSDTNRLDEANVASGPTLNPPKDAPSAIDVVQHYHLVLPDSIMKAVRRAQRSSAPVSGEYGLLLDNKTAIVAAHHKATELGYPCSTVYDIREQPIQEGCEMLLASVDYPNFEQFASVSGGEFSCRVRGNGRGGRNLETALRCAINLNTSSHVVILSAGTDGIDGNSPAAGAIADETTLQRARTLNLEPTRYLARSDSYTFFEQLNDLIVTGPTGTNVRDLRIVLKSSA